MAVGIRFGVLVLLGAGALLASGCHSGNSDKASADHLAITVSDSAVPGYDGHLDLTCHAAAGTHPDPKGACDRLDHLVASGKELFAPVPPGTVCTQQYGGPATARIVGTWSGRAVDAAFTRTDGCEMSRWDELVPLLPPIASAH
ncbi:SSI family serine proteinase inhibitor [Nocardia sp. NPDC051570]|uniref:SSI family serine proteinase inhibitor n=1 Tax=Nocardia sp. NPDC051570 TaxID=3364324 RepID=UPI0037AA892C